MCICSSNTDILAFLWNLIWPPSAVLDLLREGRETTHECPFMVAAPCKNFVAIGCQEVVEIVFRIADKKTRVHGSRPSPNFAPTWPTAPKILCTLLPFDLCTKYTTVTSTFHVFFHQCDGLSDLSFSNRSRKNCLCKLFRTLYNVTVFASDYVNRRWLKSYGVGTKYFIPTPKIP